MDLESLDHLYRNATDASAAITLTDLSGVILHVNDFRCRITGHHPEDFIGKKHFDLLPHLQETLSEETLSKHLEHNRQWRGEFCLFHKDGREVWTDTSILPIKNDQKEPTGLFILSLDITEKKEIERKLSDNQERLGLVLDSLQTAFWEWDVPTDTAWYNDNWPRMLGYDPSEMPKNFRGWADYVHPEDKERATQEMLFHIKEKTPALVSLQRFRHKDGKWVHVLTKGKVVERDKNGRAIRFLGVNNNISVISHLEDFSLHIQDLAGLGIWDVDLPSQTISWSRKVYEIFNVDPKLKPYEVRECIELFKPEHKKRIDSAYEKLKSEATPFDFNAQLMSGKWVRTAGRADIFEGKPYRAFGIIQDIDDNKIAEEELRTSQETLQLALGAGNFGVWDWDVKTDKAYWSPTMRELFSAPAEKEIFNYEDARAPIHPDDRERVERECYESLQNSDRCDNTYRIKNGDDWRWIRAIANIRKDEHDNPLRMIGVCWDVTAQIETQQAQKQAIEEAEKASKMKSQFMATVSHEIRTPMSGVIGMTELLSETELTAHQREILQTIKTCGENLLNLVNDILDYSKLEADKVSLDKKAFKLSDTIKNTLDLFQYKARQKGIKISYIIEENVPEAVTQDEARLYQVLFNIVGNAIKFTSHGEVNLTVSYSDNRLKFKVKDQGIGIPKDKLEVIFESFSQLAPGHQAEASGTGLGLSISRSLVELMGGKLTVESALNEGSCFSFDIEVSPSIIEGHSEKPEPTNHKYDLSQMRVLVVEDNPINLKLLVSILEKHEVQIEVAENGSHAIEQVKAKEYDLIFMDVQMPILDGLSATREIRKLSTTIKRQPIIVALTANVSPEHRRECLDSGMNDFLPKPIRIQTIRTLLQYHANNLAGRGESLSLEIASLHAGSPLLDRERLFREFAGFEDLLQQFTQIFLDNYATYLQQIETNLSHENLGEVAAIVHTFKGIIGNFQSTTIIKKLELLEDLARSSNLNATKDCFIDTTSLIGKVVEEIQSLSNSLKMPNR